MLVNSVMAEGNFLNQLSRLCQKATSPNLMVMQIRKPENEGTLGSDGKKNSGKELNKIEARLAERM